jgi:hypothetical protein
LLLSSVLVMLLRILYSNASPPKNQRGPISLVFGDVQYFTNYGDATHAFMFVACEPVFDHVVRALANTRSIRVFLFVPCTGGMINHAKRVFGGHMKNVTQLTQSCSRYKNTLYVVHFDELLKKDLKTQWGGFQQVHEDVYGRSATKEEEARVALNDLQLSNRQGKDVVWDKDYFLPLPAGLPEARGAKAVALGRLKNEEEEEEVAPRSKKRKR